MRAAFSTIRARLARLAASTPPEQADHLFHGTSEQSFAEVAAVVAEDDEREAALSALPAGEQAQTREEARLEFVLELEEGTAEDREQWAAMHAEAVRVLADPFHAGMVPVLRRFVEGIARNPPASDLERAQLARGRQA
jgi:hypothetical protein